MVHWHEQAALTHDLIVHSLSLTVDLVLAQELLLRSKRETAWVNGGKAKSRWTLREDDLTIVAPCPLGSEGCRSPQEPDPRRCKRKLVEDPGSTEGAGPAQCCELWFTHSFSPEDNSSWRTVSRFNQPENENYCSCYCPVSEFIQEKHLIPVRKSFFSYVTD